MTTKYAGTITPTQLAAVHADRDRWMRTALSTDRCDRDAATAAVHRAYTTAGLDVPPITIWMDSPLGGVLASGYLRHGLQAGPAKDQLRGQLRGQLGDQLWDQLGDQLRGQLRGQLGDQLWDQLRDQLRGQLRGQLGGQLWDQLGGQLWDQLRGQLRGQLGGQLWDQLGGQLRDQLRGQLWDQLGGQLRGQLGACLDPWYEAYWLAFYTQAVAVAPLPASPRLAAMADAVAETGWWWPMRGAVVMTDRPTVLARDNQGRLHCETGPALAYADGYDGHWWHGIRVPADMVAGDGWDPTRILRETNVEIRRCAIEKRGWERFVVDAGLAQVGQRVPDPGNGDRQLALYDVPEAIYDTPVRVLICENGSFDRDGTRRTFGLTVPADMPDPVTAAGWTYGVTRDEYAALARRT